MIVDRKEPLIAFPISEYSEDYGDVLWWTFPIDEPPYVGNPNDCGHTVEVVTRFYQGGDVVEKTSRSHVGGWPGYHTHWTPIDLPTAPKVLSEPPSSGEAVAPISPDPTTGGKG